MRALCFASLLALAFSFSGPVHSQARGAPGPRVKGRANMFRGVYEPPRDPEHAVFYERLKKDQELEKFSEVLSALRLPRRLLIKFASCDGTSNASYNPANGTVTFCYEYVAEIYQTSLEATAHGFSADLAFKGGVAFVLLHETGHALFDLLKVPVLGREEDAADNVAAFLLLRAGEGMTHRVLTGAAWMYLHDAEGHMPDESDFADVHGLDSQRYYNVLCMAHGSDPASFEGMVDKGYLPKERAEGCANEFHQVAYAVKTLIDPSLDMEVQARVRAARKAWSR